MKLFWKIVRYALVFAIVGFAISKLIPHFKDFSQIIELKDKIHYGWVVAAILAQIIQYLGDGWLSQLLLQMLGFKMTMKDTIRIASLNVFAAHLLPIGEAGGIAAAYHFLSQTWRGNGKIYFYDTLLGRYYQRPDLWIIICFNFHFTRSPCDYSPQKFRPCYNSYSSSNFDYLSLSKIHFFKNKREIWPKSLGQTFHFTHP